MLLIPLVSIGSSMAALNTFPPGAFPEYRLDCTQLSNGVWECSPVKQQCDSFLELGVVCKNYEDLYNDCSMTLPVTTTQSPTTKQGKLLNTRDLLHYHYYYYNSTVAVTIPVACTCTNDTFTRATTFIAVIGVMMALLLAVSVGWIVSCVILRSCQ